MQQQEQATARPETTGRELGNTKDDPTVENSASSSGIRWFTQLGDDGCLYSPIIFIQLGVAATREGGQSAELAGCDGAGVPEAAGQRFSPTKERKVIVGG
jgi:hypothetical protein